MQNENNPVHPPKNEVGVVDPPINEVGVVRSYPELPKDFDLIDITSIPLSSGTHNEFIQALDIIYQRAPESAILIYTFYMQTCTYTGERLTTVQAVYGYLIKVFRESLKLEKVSEMEFWKKINHINKKKALTYQNIQNKTNYEKLNKKYAARRKSIAEVELEIKSAKGQKKKAMAQFEYTWNEYIDSLRRRKEEIINRDIDSWPEE